MYTREITASIILIFLLSIIFLAPALIFKTTIFLIFGLALSIALMAFMANLIAKWIKTYKWIAWLGLLAILVVAIELIYVDLKILINA